MLGRRRLMLGLGALLVVLALAAIVSSMSRTRVEPSGVERYNEEAQTTVAPAVLAALGGLGLAGGLTLIGIGMGRWGRPRPPMNEADYTGPGDTHDARGPRPMV